MVNTSAARAQVILGINDNTTRDIIPADVRAALSLTLDAIDRIDKSVNVLDYGAKLDGFTDDTNAWNQALSVGKIVRFPEGRSVIRNRINFPAAEGVAIVGASRNKSTFIVDTSFNMAATSAIQFNGAYQGLKDVAIEFEQPPAGLRSEIRQYPVAIDTNGHSRSELSSLRISAAYNGIKALGNSGGAVIDDCQIGAFNKGVEIDGALDSIRLNRMHFWPFGISGDVGLFNVYSDGQTIAMEIGRCDDVNISSILCFRSRLIFTDKGDGGCFGVGSNITLDSNYGRIEFAAGEMTFSSIYGSTGASDDFIIQQTGGQMVVTGLALESGDLIQHPQVRVSGSTTTFIASDIHATVISPGTQAFLQQGGIMMLSNGFINAAVNQTRTRPLIEVTGGRASIMNMRSNDKGTGPGVFIAVTNDDWHNISGNVAPGYTYSFPATRPTGLYAPNRPATT